MQKTIEIDGRKCEFKTSAAIPRMYRIKFGRDIFTDMSKMKKELEIQEKIRTEQEKKGEIFESTLPVSVLEAFENIAFLMHRHGDSSQPTDIEKWLEQFETFDIYKILPEIIEMWGIENKQTSIPKKENGK